MNITLVSEETNHGRDYGFWLLLKDDTGMTAKSAKIVWGDLQEGVQPRPTFAFPKSFAGKGHEELRNFLMSLEAILEHYHSDKKIAEEKPSPQSDPNDSLKERLKEIMKDHVLVRKDDILSLLSGIKNDYL